MKAGLAIFAGGVLVTGVAYAIALATADRFIAPMARAAAQAAGPGITPRFRGLGSMPSRHPVLTAKGLISDERRTQAAHRVAAVPGVGGIGWADGTARQRAAAPQFEPLNCQEDVEGLLQNRTIRFREGSSAMLPQSRLLLDEVAEALSPCAGAIIAITGHTDKSGVEAANIRLSLDRARTVRDALVERGIARAGLRAEGNGSAKPVAGLTPADPANRRIEFSVVRTQPLVPTPVDTPGPR